MFYSRKLNNVYTFKMFTLFYTLKHTIKKMKR